MHSFNQFYLNILLSLLILMQFDSYVANPVPDDNEEDAVPEEPPEERSARSADTGGSLSLSQTAIDEYLKEHPEARSLIGGKDNIKLKRAYNQYGDIVMVPDVLDMSDKEQSVQKQMPQYHSPGQSYNPYAQNPYYNQIVQQGISPERVSGQSAVGQHNPGYPGHTLQGQFVPHYPPVISPPRLVHVTSGSGHNASASQDDIMDRKMDELLKLAQSYPTSPLHSYNHSPSGAMMNKSQFPVMQMRDVPGVMPEVQQSQGMPPMMPIVQGMPFQGFVPMAVNPYYQVNRQNMQMFPMPFGNLVGMDPRLAQQLESGKAQLDISNARVEPYEVTQEPQEELMEEQGTESDTLEDRPELPEVVIPKPKKLKKKRRHRKGKDGKPYFIMRARLKDLPNANQTGGNQWWTKAVPDYCYEEITEITDCKDKSVTLEKRWSFNSEDEKCYLYEDQCFSLKLNTFKSLKDCMTTCWRPKK